MAIINATMDIGREIKAQDVPLPPASAEDEIVKSLVNKDLNRGEYYLLAKGMTVEWDADDRLYLFRVPQGFWEGSSVPRASLGVPLIYEHIESLMPQIMSALFADDPCFDIIARPRTPQEAARANKEIIGYELDQMGFREQTRLCIKEALVYGTGFMKLGWKTYNKRIRVKGRKGNAKVEMVNNLPTKRFAKGDQKFVDKWKTITVSEPTCERVHVRYIVPDPKLRCPDVRKSDFLIHKEYMGVEELEQTFRKVPGNKLPDTETLKSYFNPPKEAPERSLLEGRSTTSVMNTGISSLDLNMEFKAMPRYQESTSDPNKQQLEVVEYWTKDKHYVLLNRKLVIINESNTFGEIPFRSICFTDVLDSLYGIGISRLLKGEQRLQQGVINGRLDDLSLRLSGNFIRKRGANTPAQQLRLRPGGIIDTDDEDGIKMIEYPPAITDAFTEVEASDSRAQRRTGANEMITQGGQQGPSSITRTATGMNALSAGVGARIGYLIDFISDLLFVPTLEFLQESNSKWLDDETLDRILTDELKEAYNGDPLDILNCKIKFKMLASAKAKTRQATAQVMTPFLQMVQIPAVIEDMQLQKKKVDWTEVVQSMLDAAEIAGDQRWIQPLTKEEEAAIKQKQEFAQQMATKQMDHQHRMEEIAQKGIAQSGHTVVKGLVDEVKEGADPITGEPSEDQVAAGNTGAAGASNGGGNS